jgi:16S rRNA (adenine1518-N6/adenine1519-N6)-dimethyltransferase
MVQLEVARRLCGIDDCGAITMFCKYHTDPHILFKVPRNNFIPSPNVDSAVVKMDVLPEKSVHPESEALFFECIKGGFSQKRKTLSNSLSSYFNGRLEKAEVIDALNECKIRPNARAEELSVSDFADLSDIVGKKLKNKLTNS